MRGARPARALELSVAAALGDCAGETVLAAVSGGPDSAALAALLKNAAAGRGARVVLGHVNHAARPSADRDEGVVLGLGAALRAPVVLARLDGAVRDEARMRDARYAALVRLAAQTGARRIFAAHHAEDQTETVLLALFRGAGPHGTAGMAPQRALGQGVTLVRPLLEVPRARLVACAAAERLPYAFDPSNAVEGFRRNALRQALRELRLVFPHLDAAVARHAALVRDEGAGTPRAGLRRLVRAGLAGLLGDARDVGRERVDALALALERGSRGRHFVRRDVEVVVRTKP